MKKILDSENNIDIISLIGMAGAIVMLIGGLIVQQTQHWTGILVAGVGIALIVYWFILFCLLCHLDSTGVDVEIPLKVKPHKESSERQNIIDEHDYLLDDLRKKNKTLWSIFQKSDFELRQEARDKIQDKLFDLRRKNNQTLGDSMYWNAVSDEEKQSRKNNMLSDWEATPYLT